MCNLLDSSYGPLQNPFDSRASSGLAEEPLRRECTMVHSVYSRCFPSHSEQSCTLASPSQRASVYGLFG